MSRSSLYALGTEVPDCDEEWDRLVNIAKGKRPGFITAHFDEGVISELMARAEDYKAAYDNSQRWGDLALTSLGRAAAMQAGYMLAGRRYMFTTALTKKCILMAHKAMAITNAHHAGD